MGPVRNEVFQGTSLRTLVQMVAAELGITLMPRQAVPYPGPSLAADNLARRRIQDARKSYPRVSDWYQESIWA